MLSKWLGGLAIAAAVFFSAPALAAGELTNEQKEQFGKFIHDYHISHPEIIKDSGNLKRPLENDRFRLGSILFDELP